METFIPSRFVTAAPLPIGHYLTQQVSTLFAGEVIDEYPTDQPYPSVLMLGWFDDHPLHLVAAKDAMTGQCIVITVYIPTVPWGGYRQ